MHVCTDTHAGEHSTPWYISDDGGTSVMMAVMKGGFEKKGSSAG